MTLEEKLQEADSLTTPMRSENGALWNVMLRGDYRLTITSTWESAIQEAVKAVYGEFLLEDLDNETDRAYMNGLEDAIAAIRKLVVK